MYRSIISNLIGSICSPHLRSVSVNLRSMVGEVEHFPWGVVNSLEKVSPYMLQRVEIALQLRMEAYPDWDISYPLASYPLAPDEYESAFGQVHSALPELEKILIISIGVRHLFRLFC
jgi:hypothetical protein